MSSHIWANRSLGDGENPGPVAWPREPAVNRIIRTEILYMTCSCRRSIARVTRCKEDRTKPKRPGRTKSGFPLSGAQACFRSEPDNAYSCARREDPGVTD